MSIDIGIRNIPLRSNLLTQQPNLTSSNHNPIKTIKTGS